jgi:hypothetical protein
MGGPASYELAVVDMTHTVLAPLRDIYERTQLSRLPRLVRTRSAKNRQSHSSIIFTLT